MFSVPRIIVVDDDLLHLVSLIKCLSRWGVGCLPIHFEGGLEHIAPCPHARVIFADLNLTPGSPPDHKTNFSTIGGLLRKIRPIGPYMLILWTQYPKEVTKLKKFFRERQLSPEVLKPFAIHALDKADYIDVSAASSSSIDADKLGKLVRDVECKVREESQIAALLTWEEHTLDAAAHTVNSIFNLTAPDDRNSELRRLLTNMAVAGVGKERISQSEFRAVNEALLPILADRISFCPENSASDGLWRQALDLSGPVDPLCSERKAKLNRLVHIAVGGQGNERGAVNNWPSGKNLKKSIGLQEEGEAAKQFGYMGGEGVYSAAQVHWVLVQTQAICDYAQARKGSLPFHLGLLMPEADAKNPKECQNSLWTSPDFVDDESGLIYRLHVSARYQFLLPRESVENAQVRFRLREQIVNEMIYRLHSYCARPGILQF